MSEQRQIPCYCDNLVEIEVPEEVDLASDPEAERSIREGSFLSVLCPKCGKLLKPEFPVRILDSRAGIELFLIPELERGSFLLGKSAYRLRDPQQGRIVIGYPELVEKLAILREGLDDRVVETIKFYLDQKAQSDESLQILFRAKSGDKLVFHLMGLRKDEVGISNIPFSLYETIQRELATRLTQEPFDLLLAPPYVSYQKAGPEAAE